MVVKVRICQHGGMDHQTAIKACQALHKKHGKSYYFATHLFPKSLREATYALYAFFRVPDEIVDTQKLTADQAAQALEQFRRRWHRAYTEKTSEDPVLFAAQEVFHLYKIPPEYADIFLDAMVQDTRKARYANYAELERYMYGSAAIVGLMMVRVIGTNGLSWEAVESPAKKLGEAMQLTNFLRDIQEDLELRGRIYLPQDEMQRYHITEQDIANKAISSDWKKFLSFQIARADCLYEEARKGIQSLHPRGRLAVRIAARLYQQILRKIEENNMDIFSKRVGTSTGEKLILTIKEMI